LSIQIIGVNFHPFNYQLFILVTGSLLTVCRSHVHSLTPSFKSYHLATLVGSEMASLVGNASRAFTIFATARKLILPSSASCAVNV
jgi:hypothetical protein